VAARARCYGARLRRRHAAPRHAVDMSFTFSRRAESRQHHMSEEGHFVTAYDSLHAVASSVIAPFRLRLPKPERTTRARYDEREPAE